MDEISKPVAYHLSRDCGPEAFDEAYPRVVKRMNEIQVNLLMVMHFAAWLILENQAVWQTHYSFGLVGHLL